MCCEGLHWVKSGKSKLKVNFINFSTLMNYQRDIIEKLILVEKINKMGLKNEYIIYNIMKGLKEMNIPHHIMKGFKKISTM